MRFLRILLMSIFLCASFSSFSLTDYNTRWTSHPFYFGGMVGYGSTDWSMLVAVKCKPDDEDCNDDLITVSAPTSAGDDGAMWGATIGYEIKPEWALEANFMHFPTTGVFFAPGLNAYFDKYSITSIQSKTWAAIAVAKFMTQIAHSGFRGFANAGIDFTSRNDRLAHMTRISATFGVGVNYVFPQQLMLEAGFQYIAGLGSATVTPANDYLPFLYAISVKLLYRV